MSLKRLSQRQVQPGFSLVEIMVAVVIGMFGILIIMQVFLTFEGQKRTTTGSADAQESGLIALVTMERDLRMAGLGLTGLGCSVINAYHEDKDPQSFSFAPWPAVVQQNAPAAGSDTVTVMYSSSSYGNIPTTVPSGILNSSSILNLKNGEGFKAGELVLVSEGNKPCTLVQASQDGQRTGTSWDLNHNPGVNTPYNPPGGHTEFPEDGYGPGARVTNMGALVHRQYFVQNNRLMMQDMNLPVSATNPLPLVESVVAIRAQHGRDTSTPPNGSVDIYDNVAPVADRDVVAVRVAVVARSGQLETTAVSPTTLVLWPSGTLANGGAIELDAAAQQYRYKVYHTVVPLRNVIWNG